MNITQLLKKQRHTGADVGRILVASALIDVKNIGSEDYKPIVSREEFARLERSLVSIEDLQAYDVYKGIHSAIILLQTNMQGFLQQANHGLCRYWNRLLLCIEAEQERLSAPLVLRKEQFDRAVEQARKEKAESLISPRDILFMSLRACLSDIEAAPEEIREQLMKEAQLPASKEAAYKAYNRITGRGHYKLCDGTEAPASMNEKQLGSLLLKRGKNNKAVSRILELLHKGASLIREYYYSLTREKLYASDSLIEKAWTNATIYGLVEGSKEERALTERFLSKLKTEDKLRTFIPDEDRPALNRLQLLQDCLSYYTSAGLTEFNKDYPDLYKSLEAYMREHVEETRGMKPQQYRKPFMTRQRFSEHDTVCRERVLEISSRDVTAAALGNRNEKGTDRPLAIWAEDGEQELLLSQYALKALDKDKNARESILYSLRLIRQSLRSIYAYNAVLGMLGRVYGIDNMSLAYVSTQDIEEQIAMTNNALCFKLATAATEKEKKMWERVFTPIELDELQPDQESCFRIESALKKLGMSPEAATAVHPVHIADMIQQLADGR